MKLNAHRLAKLNKEFGLLKKDEKIISINDTKKIIEEIIDMTEKLENLLSEQMSAIEDFGSDDCKNGACEIDEEEIEQSELYELYSDLEDMVLSGRLYKALRMIS